MRGAVMSLVSVTVTPVGSRKCAVLPFVQGKFPGDVGVSLQLRTSELVVQSPLTALVGVKSVLPVQNWSTLWPCASALSPRKAVREAARIAKSFLTDPMHVF